MFKEVVYYYRPYGRRYNITPYVTRKEYRDMAEAFREIRKNRENFLLWARVNRDTGEKFIRTTNKELLEAL